MKNGIIQINIKKASSNILNIIVEDNGCGIDEEIKSRLFY